MIIMNKTNRKTKLNLEDSQIIGITSLIKNKKYKKISSIIMIILIKIKNILLTSKLKKKII